MALPNADGLTTSNDLIAQMQRLPGSCNHESEGRLLLNSAKR